MGIHIETQGAGRDVVLIHGLPQAPADLQPLADDLAEGFRTHVVHLPGYGRTPALEGVHDLEAVARAVADALHERGVDDAAFIGSSAGFYRSLQIAASERAPRAWALVGLGPLAGLDEEAREIFRQSAPAVLARADISEVMIHRMLSPTFAATHPDARTHVVGMVDAAPAQTVAAELLAFAECPDLRPTLERIDVPVYVRVGALDAATPVETGRAIADSAPDGSIDVVPDSGHLLLLEDYAGTLRAVRAALTDGARG